MTGSQTRSSRRGSPMRPPRRWSSPPRSSAPIWRRRPRSGRRLSGRPTLRWSDCGKPTVAKRREDAMKLPRRNFLHVTAGAAALPALSRIAWAQTYPARPVRLIVPIAPAGASDITARLIGQWLSERLGQQFVIDNRPGGGGNIGTEAVVRAPADGYTLLLVGSFNATNAALYDKLNFNFIRDIAPIAGVFRGALVMLVHPSVPARSVPELIAYAKANPGRINMASAGNGSTSHLAGELFKAMAGVNLVHVPYRGGGPAVNDLLGGQVQV